MNQANCDSLAVADGLRVLLLDDDTFMLSIMEDMFSELGAAEICMATNGEQGLTLLENAQANPPDVLLCDLCMPGMDGVEFLRNLGQRQFSGSVILMSSVDAVVLKAASHLSSAYGLNVLGAVEKPLAEATVIEMLQRHHAEVQKRQSATPKRQQGAMEMLSAEEVRDGLLNDCVEVFFQPKVSVRERKVLGAEALARWRHPQRGILPPFTFISVVEQHGMVDEFTRAVLRKAAARLGEWKQQGHQLKVSVNVSMDNLRQLDLPEVFDGIVRDAGVEPKDIVLEMTESRLMENFTLSLDILTRFRLKNFGLSIDDFGTGYSTMESLKQLPFSELKIDRAFVYGANQDATARAILETSVALGKALNLNLVAEGVESDQEWNLVAAYGCDEVQGYYVARPMPADDFIAWKQYWEQQDEAAA